MNLCGIFCAKNENPDGAVGIEASTDLVWVWEGLSRVVSAEDMLCEGGYRLNKMWVCEMDTET